MKFRLEIASAIREFASLEEIAKHFTELSNDQRRVSNNARTLRDKAFCEGVANGHAYAARLFRNLTVLE